MRQIRLIVLVMLMSVVSVVTQAQTTEFTYQGRLYDNNVLANGQYDFQFLLFDASTGGTQLGSTITLTGVTVTNGVFTVVLDFGNQFTAGLDRYLEIQVKKPSDSTYTTLSPRQKITSAPYAVKAINADNATNAQNAVNATNATNASQLGGWPASSYVQTSTNDFIRNQTTSQSQANFNISGDGTVGGTLTGDVVNAQTQYNINGNRVLAAGIGNLFVGVGAGNSSGGDYNSFFGTSAGFNNTSNFNSFFGTEAGYSNTDGGSNSFFGSSAGYNNTNGNYNSFFGTLAGYSNTDGGNNSFFGHRAGFNNTSNFNSFFGTEAGFNNRGGYENTFMGNQAGYNNQGGIQNSFFGAGAGGANVSGSNNTAIGYQANFGSNNLQNATAIGANAYVTASDALVLGSINGQNGAYADTNVGIGTTAPQSKLHISGSGVVRARINSNSNAGVLFTLNDNLRWSLGAVSQNGSDNFLIYNETGPGTALLINPSNNIGIGENNPQSKLHISGIGAVRARINSDSNAGVLFTLNNNLRWSLGAVNESGSDNFLIYNEANGLTALRIYPNNNNIWIASPPVGVGTILCLSSTNLIVTCSSSSLRYKTNVEPFRSGLELVRKLQPIRYNWKTDGKEDVGFAAEEVEKVNPLLVTYNERGEVEGVKYERLTTVLVNAVTEQQEQIETQQKQIETQEKRIEQQQRQIEEQRAENETLQRQVSEQQKQIETQKAELEKQRLKNEELERKVEAQQRQLEALKRLICSQKSSADVCKQ